ncbi:MAG TPA: protein-L-isoaspartate(D-aspartate) O-methyltransferase [Alphaproteobacteria bacterium]|jgi:protein-L-isoaspartate(D-aspartate) O-methyltransferase|nr:protein-L-isoaspartate(D-aspartate) O-methyltransferase [Alphaproteobacteria bacterium]
MTLAARKVRFIMELRTAGVSDTRVLAAIERIARERFVPDLFRDQAYDNIALPIGGGQTISQPHVVARMTQALLPDKKLKVLEIGTGSGYQTAVLSKLFRRVYTIERDRELLGQAEARLAALHVRNVTAMAGDGAQGWPKQAPFERIIVTAAPAEEPKALLDQLAVGGVMVIPLGADKADQMLVRIRRTAEGFEREEIGPVRFVPLVSGQAAAGRARA